VKALRSGARFAGVAGTMLAALSFAVLSFGALMLSASSVAQAQTHSLIGPQTTASVPLVPGTG
jgi:hypothetical protein